MKKTDNHESVSEDKLTALEKHDLQLQISWKSHKQRGR